MPENTSSSSVPGTSGATPTTPTTPAEKPTRTPGIWNKAQLAELSKSERLCLAAQQDKYAAVFTKRKIAAKDLTKLQDDITEARTQTATANEASNEAGDATLSEARAEQVLLTAIRTAQAAAKQQYARSAPEKLQDYLVGSDIASSRAALEQAAHTILTKADADRLPGIDTEFITQLTANKDAYVQANATQGSQDSQAMAERLKRNYQIESIKDRRIAIQYAIDGAYPYTDPQNAPVRSEFELSPNRPFNAVKRAGQ